MDKKAAGHSDFCPPHQMMDTDLIDKFVHRAFPFEQDFVEAPEATGIGHIPGVGDCHGGALISLFTAGSLLSQRHRKCIFNVCSKCCYVFSDTLLPVIMF